MELNVLRPRQALNKAYLKLKPTRSEIEVFKNELIKLIDQTNDTESEEFHKNLVSTFLKKTYYKEDHFINTKDTKDLVIHEGKTANSPVSVIIEAKKPTNKAEMVSAGNMNAKALQETVLYFLRERILDNNPNIKYIIITNIYEWFIFDATIFEKLFVQDKIFVKSFKDFGEGRLSGKTTEFFYSKIAKPFIDSITSKIEFVHFDIRKYDKPLRNDDKKDDTKLIALYKLLSPQHLLKLPFANDSNTLDKKFYGELLHLIGLTETKKSGKKVIERLPEGKRNSASLLENAIIQLDSEDAISNLKNKQQYGETSDEQLFSVALELIISWVNRTLFLKLLESQLVTYHKQNTGYAFLNSSKIKNFDDLNRLFFQVLAKEKGDRNEDVKATYANVPYLNSSLFEPTDLERKTLKISNLVDNKLLPIISTTVLKKGDGKKLKGELNTIEYFFSFLDAYDFSSDSGENIQEENKSLISASVLGLIYEKINGYKDGSFFTPGFVTMYMCREAIRKAVISKFNDAFNWSCTSITDVYNKIDDIDRANEVFNTLKICDPAVGSGHFLVSALNELLSVKHELGILRDENGKRIKNLNVDVVNDELVISDEDGELFEYNSESKESQRIQKSLFNEKQTIIENCLFGVDINPNSVKICRLRLWVELLKNAYYKAPTELETLPNIDINIKCGNSLISRFDYEIDLKKAFRKSNIKISDYRSAVNSYKNAKSKEEKRGLEKLIDRIYSSFRTEIYSNDPKIKSLNNITGELAYIKNQHGLFEETPTERKEKKRRIKELTAKLEKLNIAIEGIRNNKIYENAFEWKFEFPEVLDNSGNFLGFDAVIGNPPYVFGGNKGISQQEKDYFRANYVTGKGKINLFTLFIERSRGLMSDVAQFTFIVPNTFLRVTSYDASRRFFLENFGMSSIYNFGDAVFEDAVTTAIALVAKSKTNSPDDPIIVFDGKSEIAITNNDIIENDYVISITGNRDAKILVKKISGISTLLADYCKEMIFGIVISGNRNELVKDNYKPNLKPFLEGKDIGAYCIKPIHMYLDYAVEKIHRPRSKEIFEAKEKILIQRITGGIRPLKATLDSAQIYNKESINNIILKDDATVSIRLILGLLNSKLLNWFYSIQYTNESNLTVNLSKAYLSQLPICTSNKSVVSKIEAKVEDILKVRESNHNCDITPLENDIDILVYDLYGLDDSEINIIEKKFLLQ